MSITLYEQPIAFMIKMLMKRCGGGIIFICVEGVGFSFGKFLPL